MQATTLRWASAVVVGTGLGGGLARGSDPPIGAGGAADTACPIAPLAASRAPAMGVSAPPPRSWSSPTDAVLFDNGPFATGPAAAGGCPGDQSLLQNATLCLNLYGWSAFFEPGLLEYNVADDFMLGFRAKVESVTVFAYEVGAMAPSIVGGDLRIHAAMPLAPAGAILATSSVLAGPAAFTATYRQSEVGAGAAVCTRHIQAVTFVFAPPVCLDAGEYWISFRLTGGALAGPFVPAVTIVGAPGAPLGNGMQDTLAGGLFAPVSDAGIAGCFPAPPVPNPQEFPFVVEGTGVCWQDCNCDGALTVADFGCFQTKALSGEPYGDCNGDGVLTVADFGCFHTMFVVGCP